MTKRYIAHITIEAQTPLKVGSGSSDFLQDSPIQKDWNGLPMILGTSIAGVLRKDYKGDVEDIFGETNGSKVIFSNALLLDSTNKVHETLLLEKNDFLKNFNTLPIREHTAITSKGIAKDHSKFDEEVLYKGSRFKFSIEMIGDENDSQTWKDILNLLSKSSFRLGGGSTKGFGKLKILEIKEAMFALNDESYINLTSSLNEDFGAIFKPTVTDDNYTTYRLELKADDFFMFGSGFGDDDADATPVYEKVVDYEKGGLSDEKVLIPASSIKGAIAHRTTYHYNLLEKLFIGNEKARESISEIFGEAKSDKDEGSKGRVLFADLYQDKKQTKVFDHVKIDRFTGGAMDGALFQEKTISDSTPFVMEILVEKEIDERCVQAYEKTLDDICNGMLPLGGSVNRGHGVFSGKWSKV
ncbi:MAG TPA: CRISPR-associated protein [Sulfurimonas autotrophica]|nr:CRISPR-associated protein [Sulfurimonas autotrophica]